MKKTFVIALVSGVVFFAACQNKSNTTTTAEGQPAAESTATPHTFTDIAPKTAEMMQGLFGHYTHLKNAMVNADAKEAKAGATAFLEVITSFDTTALTAEQYKVYAAYMGAIKNDAQHIAESDDIAHQREHLATLSDNMYEVVKAFGAGKNVYYSFCPMANHNKGAYWLSESEKIRNPYFGSQMMECGEVTDVVK